MGTGSTSWIMTVNKIKLASLIFIAFVCTLLVACDDVDHYAPVVEVSTIESIPTAGIHHVTSGETLYEVAWRYGLDYRYLAQVNRISSPYRVYQGQTLILKSKEASVVTTQPQVESEPSRHGAWLWPAKGKIINSFSTLNKGINIAGRRGESIHAAAAGTVVYSGDGLRGYGNLVILKHDSLYLSAYAHNKINFVKEGDKVKQGQVIGQMGETGTDKVMLHFEIRRAGRPINPITLYHRIKL